MDGILCINKPQEYTSFDVVARIRGMSKTKRVGHSGTLDPMATGVLPIFLGNATKACDLLPDERKSYRAGFRLGVTTDTLDIFGTIRCEQESHCAQEEILPLLEHFRGKIQQIPPMYSAVRIDGQRLYDLARQGREVERAPRTVFIHAIELAEFDPDAQSGLLEITCSKGTYVRTIIHDLGQLLGCGAAMTSLVRTFSGGFGLNDCITLEEAQHLTDTGRLEASLLPVDLVFADYPKIQLNPVQSIKFKNGVQLDLNRLHYQGDNGTHRIYDESGRFLGLARPHLEEMALIIEKMFTR